MQTIKMRWTHVVVVLGTSLLASCITHNPRRTFDEVNHVGPSARCAAAADPTAPTSIAKLQDVGPSGDAERVRVSCASVEQHAPLTTGPYPHNGFKLHVLEFDDDGVPWNAEQQRASLEYLKTDLRVPSLVVVFVHGWKNDANVCNGNLACFRELLEVLSKAETSFGGSAARQVIGVYIGWRGGTLDVKGLNAVTFWGRKHTAHVIGDNGAVTAVIERLRDMLEAARRRSTPSANAIDGAMRESSMVFVGHSFGGALLFSALATSLNASVGAAIETVPTATSLGRQATQPPIATREVCVPSRGDLVVLVNPAMEASRFANLAQTRNLQFSARQVPIFMTLASEADGPVGGFFPIGQAVSTVSRAARSREFWMRMDKGFGLYEPYHTHRLVLGPPGLWQDQLRPPDKAAGTCVCTSNLAAAGNRILDALQPMYRAIRALREAGQQEVAFEQLRLAGYQEMFGSRLEPVRDVDPHNPFVMASIDRQVVGGHSDIFNPRFLDFLTEYVIRSEIKRNLARTLGRECRR